MAVSPGSAFCPSGWSESSAQDEHTVVFSCGGPDNWVVFLHEDGTFSHGFQKDTLGATIVTESSEVPGWPR